MDEQYVDPGIPGSSDRSTGTVRVRIGGNWHIGTYEISGRTMVVLSSKGAKSACVGLLDHKKLAKALLAKLLQQDEDRGQRDTQRSNARSLAMPASASSSESSRP